MDVEMAFTDSDGIMGMMERLVTAIFMEVEPLALVHPGRFYRPPINRKSFFAIISPMVQNTLNALELCKFSAHLSIFCTIKVRDLPLILTVW